MRVFIAIAALIQLSLAQENLYRCDCAFFADSQIDDDYFGDQGAAPLYATYTEFDPYVCTYPEGGAINPCKDFCQDWGNKLVEDGFNYCTRTPGNSDRCYGGAFCEVLAAEGFPDVEDDALKLYYRMPECPADHREWVDCSQELGQAICCEDGRYESCYGIDCECYKNDARRYCECGVFVPEQIAAANGSTALPLAYVGNLTDGLDAGYCAKFGGFFDPCRDDCAESGEAYFDTYRLTDIPPGSTTETYGDLYCAGFKSRYVFFQGCNTELTVYQRAPDCPTPEWLLVPDTTHPERICCDSDGRHIYPCLEEAN